MTVDRGWSWVILAGSFGCSFLIFGTMAGGGIFYKAFLDKFEGTHLETIWVMFFMQMCLNFMGPIAAYLGGKFSYRKLVITGGIVANIGLLTSSFAPSIYYLYGSFGLLYGIGIGFVVNPHIVVVNYSFEKYRALANGIFSSGASIGSMIIPPTLEALKEFYGLSGLLLIWSGVMLNLCVCGSLYRIKRQKTASNPIEKKKEIYGNEISKDTTNGLLLPQKEIDSTQVQKKSKWKSLSFFANFYFWLISFGWSFVTFSIACFTVIVPEFSVSQNDSISLSNASLLVSFWAIGDLVGRIVSGWIIDRKWFELKHFYIFSMSSASISAISMQFMYSYPTLAVCSFSFGIFLGSSFIQHPLLVIKCLGIEAFRKAFGFLGLFAGVTLVGLTSVVGYLRDTTGSNHANFTVIGVLLFLPCCVWIIEIVYNFVIRKKEHTKSKDQEMESVQV